MSRDFDKRFNAVLLQYAERYDIESLTNPNDKANLDTMIRNQLVIEELQRQMHKLAIEDAVGNAQDIKRINDSIVSLSATNMQYEKTLGIDRKSRTGAAQEDPVTYITTLKKLAKEFVDERLIKVYCKECNIMVGRVSGVYDTTAFKSEFTCPQCNKISVITRKERDIFYDLKKNDRDWRRKYPIEIVQPQRSKVPELADEDIEMVIGDEFEDGDIDGINTETI